MKETVKAKRDGNVSMGRKFRIMLMVAALAFAPAVLAAPAAHAGTYDDLGGKPGQQCRPKSLGNSAGSGFPGLVDPAPAPIVADGPSPGAAAVADTWEQGANKTIYHVYGWAGYNWESCATGGPIEGAEALGNTSAWSDSEIGSTMLKMATGIAALNTGVAKMSANPGDIMKPLDDIVVQVSGVVKTVLVDLWLPILLVAAAVLIAVNAIGKNTRKAAASVGAILAALVGIAFLSFAPLKAAQAMDGVAAAVQTSVLQKALEVTGKTDIPPEETWGVIYTDEVIFPLWADGLTNWGQSDSRLSPNLEAERLGNTIDAKQKFEKFTPTQAYQIRSYAWDAEKTEQTTKDRRDAWNTIGEASQTPDAPTRAFTGQDNNRSGTGFMALASTASIAAFSIPANLMTFFALIAFRMIPILGLLACLLLAFEPTRPLATKIGRFFFSALVNGVVLGTFAAIHLAIVGSLFASGTSFLWATVGTAIVSIIFLKITKPVQMFTGMVSSAGKMAARGTRSIMPSRKNKAGDPTKANRNQGTKQESNNPGTTNTQSNGHVAPLKRQPAMTPPKKKPTMNRPMVHAALAVASKVPQTAGIARVAQGAMVVSSLGSKSSSSNSNTKAAGENAPGRSNTRAAGKNAPTNSNTQASGKAAPTGSRGSGTRPAHGNDSKRAGDTKSGGYKSLQQAQQGGRTSTRKARIFVPPNSKKEPQQQARKAPEKGDRPTARKFQPAAQSNNQRADNQPVQPLKNRS